MRAMRAEWHDRYTLPVALEMVRAEPRAHGSYWFDWTTPDEIEWKNNYRLWMTFVNEYKNRGGRVTTGSDSGSSTSSMASTTSASSSCCRKRASIRWK